MSVFIFESTTANSSYELYCNVELSMRAINPIALKFLMSAILKCKANTRLLLRMKMCARNWKRVDLQWEIFHYNFCANIIYNSKLFFERFRHSDMFTCSSAWFTFKFCIYVFSLIYFEVQQCSKLWLSSCIAFTPTLSKLEISFNIF